MKEMQSIIADSPQMTAHGPSFFLFSGLPLTMLPLTSMKANEMIAILIAMVNTIMILFKVNKALRMRAVIVT